MGSSDHKAIKATLDFKGTISKRVQSQINRKQLQEYVRSYVENFNIEFKTSNSPLDIYN